MLKNIIWQHRGYIIPPIAKKYTAIFFREEVRFIDVGTNDEAAAIRFIGTGASTDSYQA